MNEQKENTHGFWMDFYQTEGNFCCIIVEISFNNREHTEMNRWAGTFVLFVQFTLCIDLQRKIEINFKRNLE